MPTPPKRQPVRTCVACRTAGGKRGLLRLVRLPDGAGIALDPTGKQSGRGAYVCATSACVELALKRKAFERSLKTALTEGGQAELRAAIPPENAV
ncbi:RNase P modulator RnpM [Armatimonas sp.]|uniref:RNase P modulator RnpM n=1 Tax=Armatimonas sp. TaxID=1872638 RepID=UPI00286B4BDB|nr:YlxR family protein [Armatimonas sp.]